MRIVTRHRSAASLFCGSDVAGKSEYSKLARECETLSRYNTSYDKLQFVVYRLEPLAQPDKLKLSDIGTRRQAAKVDCKSVRWFDPAACSSTTMNSNENEDLASAEFIIIIIFVKEVRVMASMASTTANKLRTLGTSAWRGDNMTFKNSSPSKELDGDRVLRSHR